MSKQFADLIRQMNTMYRLPVFDTPELPPDLAKRVQNFKITIGDEVEEADEIVKAASSTLSLVSHLDVAVMLADWLGDLIVYARSEALKYGIPLEDVLDIIMASNASKLGADGNPIYNEQGKFLKGPNYWKPEPRIRELLDRCAPHLATTFFTTKEFTHE